jgi:pantoate--beta-alanine ligase
MGHLHEGHLQLLKQSVAENDITVLSIFVNPTQFNNPQDFENYPKTLEQDLKLAQRVGTDFVLLPTYQELYPDEYTYHITESCLSLPLEGAYRPGHFEGMLTVVMKLLNIVKAQRAYFGEKDYQQLQLVKGLVRAFFIPTQIIPCKTLRHPDGLAMSSRNSRLSPTARQQAALFPKLLLDARLTDEAVTVELQKQGFTVDYIKTQDSRRFGAVTLEGVRLIDNGLIHR